MFMTLDAALKASEARKETAISQAKASHKKTAQKIETLYQVLPLLDAAGFRPSWTGEVAWGDASYEIEADQLVDFCKVTGHVEEDGTSIANTRKHMIWVHLRPVAYPMIRVSYQRKLKKTDKCKIVRSKAQFDHSLVCNR